MGLRLSGATAVHHQQQPLTNFVSNNTLNISRSGSLATTSPLLLQQQSSSNLEFIHDILCNKEN